MKCGFLFVAVFIGVVCVSGVKAAISARLNDFGQAKIKVVSWNVQTFFDGHTDGTEFAEFNSTKSKWNKDAYIERLKRLCASLKALDGDVVVLEEIENEGVLYDISNMTGNAWKGGKAYAYGFFAKPPNGNFGCAMLSRYPLEDASVHSVMQYSREAAPPSLRPMLKATVNAGGKRIVLFAAHWKSKSGGGSDTEVWRKLQEQTLAYQILKTKPAAIIACGDFNRDIREFSISGKEAALYTRKGGEVRLYNPWLDYDESFEVQGSFYYQGQWERIDNFFSEGELQLDAFKVEAKGDWADPHGFPYKYRVSDGKGYSDHFPISCTALF